MRRTQSLDPLQVQAGALIEVITEFHRKS